MVDEKNVRTVLVVGAGIMGSGIVTWLLPGGFNTILNDVSEELLQKARERIRIEMQKGVDSKNRQTPLWSAFERIVLDSVLDRAAGRCGPHH
jgi:3-hydroxyacyl-CoA dehydrogenase